MTTLQDHQPQTQRSCTMHFQSHEIGASDKGAVTQRDVRTTNKCDVGDNCGHITSNLEALWYNHDKPSVVQYRLPGDESVYEIRAKGEQETECDGPTETIPYAWTKTSVTFKAPDGWGKGTLLLDDFKMDQSGMQRDKTVYFEDDDTLVRSAKTDEQEGEVL